METMNIPISPHPTSEINFLHCSVDGRSIASPSAECFNDLSERISEKTRLKFYFLAQTPMNFEDSGVNECLRIGEYDIRSAEGPTWTSCKGFQEIIVMGRKHAPRHRGWRRCSTTGISGHSVWTLMKICMHIEILWLGQNALLYTEIPSRESGYIQTFPTPPEGTRLRRTRLAAASWVVHCSAPLGTRV